MTSQKPIRKSRKNKYTSHACTNCQKKKTRCKPSDIPGEPCERCLRDGTECIYLPKKKRRGRRKRNNYTSDVIDIPDGSTRSYQQMSTIMSNPSTTIIPHSTNTKAFPLSFSNTNTSFPTLHTRRTGRGLDRLVVPNKQITQYPYSMEIVNSPDLLAPMLEFEDIGSSGPLALKDETSESQNMKQIDPILNIDTSTNPIILDDNRLYNSNVPLPISHLDFTTPISSYPSYIVPEIENIDENVIDLPENLTLDQGEVSPSSFLDYDYNDRKFADVTDPDNEFNLGTPEKLKNTIPLPDYSSSIGVPNTQTNIQTSIPKPISTDFSINQTQLALPNGRRNSNLALNGPLSQIPEKLLPMARKGVLNELDDAISTLPTDGQVYAIFAVQSLIDQLKKMAIKGAEQPYQNTTTFEEEEDSFDDTYQEKI